MKVSFSVAIFVIVFSFGCRNEGKPKPLYMDVDNERGVYGCGIPCAVPPPSTCYQPNGICMAAVIRDQVSVGDVANSAFRLSNVGAGTKIRFEFIKPQIIDRADLRSKVLNDIKLENEKLADQITDFISSHFNVPGDMPFSKESSKIIIATFKLKGKSVILKAGEYEIIKSKEYPNGYFEVDIVTADDILG